MTNTKFRKRALLSSVAMLLVALIALGSATFAWFAANPTVYADTLKMQATAGAGIQIVSEYDLIGKTTTEEIGSAYGYSTDLSAGTALALDPASPYVSETRTTSDVKFGFVDGTASDNKTAKGTFNDATTYSVIGTPTTGRVFYEDIYLKSTNGDAVTVTDARVDITSTTHTGANKQIEQGVKVALVKADGTLIGIWKAASGQDSKVWNGGKTANTPATDLADAAAGTYINNNTAKTGLNLSVAGKIKGEEGAVKVRMYVYLDGENQYVFSDNALTATELFSAINVTFSTAAL